VEATNEHSFDCEDMKVNSELHTIEVDRLSSVSEIVVWLRETTNCMGFGQISNKFLARQTSPGHAT
jgi:hypothetical protein